MSGELSAKSEIEDPYVPVRGTQYFLQGTAKRLGSPIGKLINAATREGERTVS